jgi:hypothetical protein
MDELSGPGQSSTLVQMGTLGDKLSYAAVDDCVRSISMETNEYRSVYHTMICFILYIKNVDLHVVGMSRRLTPHPKLTPQMEKILV